MRFAILVTAVSLTGCVISPLPQQVATSPTSVTMPARPAKVSLPNPISPDACVEDWYTQAELPACVKDWVVELSNQQNEIAKKKAGKK